MGREPVFFVPIDEHQHHWCLCFGACPCNKAACVSCGIERPMTDEELAEKDHKYKKGGEQ